MKAVIYTRVSTDGQREASHDDQERNCRRIADREGWSIAHRYTDHALSGARRDRPDYRALLIAAKAGEFDVLLLDELSRFSRDTVESERAIRSLEYCGVRVVSADGYDSTSRSRKLHRGMKALMNAEFIEAVRHETHRGQEGVVRKGLSSGGRAYGYRSEPILDPRGERVAAKLVIHDAEAKVVREIFRRYADGWSPRRVADDLNRRGVPSPGADWHRSSRRNDGKWLASAIYGDPKRGSGILNNEIYRGVRVWNRSRRDRDPETDRAVFKRRRADEHVVVEVPHLRIVDETLWSRVHDRRVARSAIIGAAVKKGLSVHAAGGRAGALARMKRHLWSGLLKCGDCGASLVVVGEKRNYVCASRTHGGKHACGSTLNVPLARVEERLPAAIRRDLLAPEAEKLFTRAVRDHLAARRRESVDDRRDRTARLEKSRATVENLTDAIATIGLRNDPTLSARLLTARTELAMLEQDAALGSAKRAKVVDLLPSTVVETYRERVARFGKAVFRSEDLTAAAAELAALFGGAIPVTVGKDGPVAELRMSAGTLLAIGLGATVPAETRCGSGGRI